MLISELAGFDISSSWKAGRHAQCGFLVLAGLLADQFGRSLSSRQQRFSSTLGVFALSNLFHPVRLDRSGRALGNVG
jgi:hypothetical protein